MTPGFSDEAFHSLRQDLNPREFLPATGAETTSILVLQDQVDPLFNNASAFEQAKNIHENNYESQSSGQYPRAGDARWETSSVHRPQRPPRHQSRAQGSLQSGPLSINNMYLIWLPHPFLLRLRLPRCLPHPTRFPPRPLQCLRMLKKLQQTLL